MLSKSDRDLSSFLAFALMGESIEKIGSRIEIYAFEQDPQMVAISHQNREHRAFFRFSISGDCLVIVTIPAGGDDEDFNGKLNSISHFELNDSNLVDNATRLITDIFGVR